MVRHAGVLADARQVSHESPERGAVGQQDGEMIESDESAACDGTDAGFCVQLDEHAVVAVRTERRHVALARETRRPITLS